MRRRVTAFQPPLPTPWIEWIFLNFLNPYFLCHDVTIDISEESLNRWKTIPPDSGVLVAVKHADFIDHLHVATVAHGFGERCYYISIPETFAEFFGFGGVVVRRLGAFTIERGGINIRANRFIVDALVQAKRPMVIFPEGELHFLNDIVTPLKAGLALFALEGAEARAKAGKPNSMVILPIGLKYVYPKNIQPLLEQKLAACEKAAGIISQPGELLPRLSTLAEKALHRAESQHHLKTIGSTYEERFLSLGRLLIEGQEMEEYGKILEGDLLDRVRRLMMHLQENQKPLEKAQLAVHALAFFPGYLSEPTQERLMETLRKLERVITGSGHPSFPGKKILKVKIQEPIAVEPYLPLYQIRKTKKTAIEQLSAAAQTSLQSAVNELIGDTSH